MSVKTNPKELTLGQTTHPWPKHHPLSRPSMIWFLRVHLAWFLPFNLHLISPLLDAAVMTCIQATASNGKFPLAASPESITA